MQVGRERLQVTRKLLASGLAHGWAMNTTALTLADPSAATRRSTHTSRRRAVVKLSRACCPYA
jgi:hypothetical protein